MSGGLNALKWSLNGGPGLPVAPARVMREAESSRWEGDLCEQLASAPRFAQPSCIFMLTLLSRPRPLVLEWTAPLRENNGAFMLYL